MNAIVNLFQGATKAPAIELAVKPVDEFVTLTDDLLVIFDALGTHLLRQREDGHESAAEECAEQGWQPLHVGQ